MNTYKGAEVAFIAAVVAVYIGYGWFIVQVISTWWQ